MSPPDPDPARVPPAEVPYLFGTFRIVDRFNVGELSSIERSQLIAAGKNVWAEAAGIDDLLAATEEEDMFWEVVRVTDGAALPLYDAWFVGAQSGTLFHADTASASGFVMIDSSFVAERSATSPGATAAMKAAYVAARPAFDDWMEAYEAYWAAFRDKEAATADPSRR